MAAKPVFLTRESRRQIALVFRSNWERDFKKLSSPKIRALEKAPQIIDVSVTRCETGGPIPENGFELPVCDITLKVQFASGKLDTIPESWRFARSPKGKWVDALTYVKNPPLTRAEAEAL